MHKKQYFLAFLFHFSSILTICICYNLYKKSLLIIIINYQLSIINYFCTFVGLYLIWYKSVKLNKAYYGYQNYYRSSRRGADYSE